MKKLCCFALLLTLCMALVPAQNTAGAVERAVKVLPVEQDISWIDEIRMVAVDADTKMPIPLSDYNQGNIYAYVPEQTTLEVVFQDEIIFSDYGTEYFTLPGQFLAARAVMMGDGDGNFLPEKELTRAELAAILARVLQLPGASGAEFIDVPQDTWYAAPVGALEKAGIVAKADRFEPDRMVTNEEMHTMLYRMFTFLGGMAPAKNLDTASAFYEDFDDVSPYAREAYAALLEAQFFINGESEFRPSAPPQNTDPWDATDVPEDDTAYFLKPKNMVTRAEAAEVLYRQIQTFLQQRYPALPREAAIQSGLDKEMPRMDGSTSSYPITETLYSTLFKNGRNHPQCPRQHSKTITSYERLINKEVDLILVPDPNSDVKQLMEDTGVDLKFIPIANEALVFFTNKKNTTQGITQEQIKEIYLNNSIKNWIELGGPDAAFAAFCRNNDSGSHAQMERFFLNGQEINSEIRKERTSVMMASILTDVEAYEQMHPGTYALGYSMYYYFVQTGSIVGNEHLKLLAIDGVIPSEATIGDGIYPLSTHYYAVLRAEEAADSPANRLAAYLVSEPGQEMIKACGFGPLQ